VLQRLRRGDGPVYRGTLHVDGLHLDVELFQILDGRGFECLAFNPADTSAGCLWPKADGDKRSETGPDYFRTATLAGSAWRLRAWCDGEVLRVRVKA